VLVNYSPQADSRRAMGNLKPQARIAFPDRLLPGRTG